MSAEVRGWCPGAWRPMMSGDGLVVRIRPRMGRIDRDAALALGSAARVHGSGVIELTRRGNVQIRGVTEATHPPLLEALSAAGLLDPDPATEARRNVLVQPFRVGGDATETAARAVLSGLHSLPDLPAKFGIAVDAGPSPVLARDPADIRIERGAEGLIVRADGSTTGLATDDPAAGVLDLANWFALNAGAETRMARLLERVPLPDRFTGTPALPTAHAPSVGPHALGILAGAPFGQIHADLWDRAALAGRALRITPWRMLLIEGASMAPEGLVTDPGDPILSVDACPGAPFCPQATVETRSLARRLAAKSPGLHVSGCTKGCARSRPAPVTLVGRDGRFDLVKNGRAGDTPHRRGLTPTQIPDAL